MTNFVVYTDGGFRKKIPLGSWGFIILDESQTLKIKRYGVVQQERQTSQVAEMTAILNSMKFVFEILCQQNATAAKTVDLVIISDSQYCVNTLNVWLYKWIKHNDLSHRPNSDLWASMLEWKLLFKSVEMKWVKGHNGEPLNEEVDRLTQDAFVEYFVANPNLVT